MTEHPLGAIILTGGASRRMGADKATQLWGQERAVDLVAGLAASAGAALVISAGPGRLGLPRALDAAPHGGPVGGILSGLAWLGGRCAKVLVLAVDAPTLRLADIAPLLSAPSPGAVFAGLPLPMVLDPHAAPADAAADWPVRRFAERSGLAQLEPNAGSLARLRGANTPQEQAGLLG